MDVKTVQARRGIFRVLNADEFVGKALIDYGEYGEGEIKVFEQLLQPGDVVIDVGANIGALSVPMGQLVGKTGKVIAFEPGDNNVELLEANLAANTECDFTIMHYAAGAEHGEVTVAQVASPTLWRKPEKDFHLLGPEIKVKVIPIDDLDLPRCKLIKIDVDGMEAEVIRGMDQTIRRCRPFIYIENEQPGKQAELIAELTKRGYRLWWHRPYQYNKDNFFNNKKNWFGNIVSIMMVCAPLELGATIDGMDEVSDIREDDEMYEREVYRYTLYKKYHPTDPWVRAILAHNLNLMGRLDESKAEIDEALKIDPAHVPSLAIRGLHALQAGEFDAGWKGFQLRFKQRNTRSFGGHRYVMHGDKPEWKGERTDQTVLIWSEQGFGDMMMWARFMPMVLERAPNAILECHSSLFELFEQSNLVPPGCLYRLHRSLPDYDLHCSLPSVTAAMNVSRDDIAYAGREPYLIADPGLIRTWRERGNPSTAGICHRGSAKSERPLTRDIPAPLFDQINKFGPFFHLHQGGQFENFADTAAAIATLDLVITVDTVIAHLAGAMHTPTILLLSTDPDWRWGLRGNSSIWYPTMRILRQKKFRDWSPVMDTLEEILEEREAADHRRGIASFGAQFWNDAPTQFWNEAAE
jgi:FkbM family methyltransferase